MVFYRIHNNNNNNNRRGTYNSQTIMAMLNANETVLIDFIAFHRALSMEAPEDPLLGLIEETV